MNVSVEQQNLPVLSSAPAAEDAQRSSHATAGEPALSLLEILLKHKRTLILSVALMLVLGVVYQITATKVYTSSSEVFIQRTGSEGGPKSPLSPTGLSASSPSTQASVLKSTDVLKRALQNPEVSQSQTLAEMDDSHQLTFLRKNIKVDFARERETVLVSFTTPFKQDAATIVNAVVEAYMQHQEVRGKLRDGREPVVDADGETGVMTDQMIASRLMMLSDEIGRADLAKQAAAIRLEKARRSNGDVAMIASMLSETGVDTRSFGMAELAYLNTELSRVQQQLDGMPEGWGRGHAVRGPLQKQADSLSKEIQGLKTNAAALMMSVIEQSYDTASQNLAALQQKMQAQQDTAMRVAQLPIVLIEPAQVPLRHASPRGIKTMGLALFLGLALGSMLVLRSELKAGSALVGETLDRPARQAADVSLPMLMHSDDVDRVMIESAVPTLGMVPQVPTGQRARLTSPNFDATASSIHQIRAVLQVRAGSMGTRAYAFTSPRRGAGKTSVTIGVASSLAMSGTRTLVVDCDLAGRIARGQTGKPAERKVDPFGPIDEDGSSATNASLDNIVLEQGYLNESDSKAMTERVDDEQFKSGVTGMLDGGSLDECLVEATVPGLSLLPAVNANTSHIGRMSDAFIRRLIDEARARFDLVLFDTGPIPGSVEALLVTSQADGVVIVVPQGENQAALARTMSYLKVVNAKITGTVFNKATSTPEPDASEEVRQASAAARAAMAKADEMDRRDNDLDDDDDSEFVDGDVALGSGILAAAVFSDNESGYENQDWKLKGTSSSSGEFKSSVDDLFDAADALDAKDDADKA